jgi:hypothetical protein
MDSLRNNAGTITIGIAVFAGLAFIVIRMIANARKGKTACGWDVQAAPKALQNNSQGLKRERKSTRHCF